MKPERRFVTAVERKLPESLYRQSMFTPYSNGTPDKYYEGPGGCLWIEYKWLPKTPPQCVALDDLLTPLQQRWLRRAHGHGVPVRVVIGCPTGAAVVEAYLDYAAPSAFHWTKEELAEWITRCVAK